MLRVPPAPTRGRYPEFAEPAGSAIVVSRTTGRGNLRRESQADVAQLVERNLAKVEVASSSLVVRSEKGRCPASLVPSLVEWPRGEATDCKSVYTGSNPVSTSKHRAFRLTPGDWRSGSALP